MKKYLLLVLLLSSFLGFSQFNPQAPWMQSEAMMRTNAEGKTINEISNAFDAYWKDRDHSKKGSGYKPFMRWLNHWETNTDDKGNLITPSEVWTAFNQKQARKLDPSYTVTTPPSNWIPLGPFQNVNNNTRARGRVNVVYVDPTNANTIYMGTPAGGLWKSTNAGTSWIPLGDNLPQIGVSGVAVDPNNPNIVYISTGDCDASDTYSIGVLKSLDGGLTWNTTGLTFTNTTTLSGDILINPTDSNMLWCATSVGLQRSTDAGVTWTVVQAGNFATGRIRLKPGTPSTVYAVSTNKFFRSTNSGQTFTSPNFNGFNNQSSRLLLDVTPANPEYIYILNANTNFTFQGIFRSTNGGTTWAKTSTASTADIFNGATQAWYDLALAASPTNADEIYTGCLNIWKSTNGGAVCTEVNQWNVKNAAFTHADIHYLQFFGSSLYCGSDGGIYVTTDGGINFTDKTAEAQISQFYSVSVAKQTATKINGGLQDNGGYAYSNGLWRSYHGGDGMDSAIDPTNSNNFYGFMQYGNPLWTSTDSGVTLTGSIGAPTGQNGNWVTPLIANNSGEIFAGYANLYRLQNGNWVQQNTGSLGAGNIDEIAVDPSNDNIMFVSNANALYKSINKGLTFTLVYTAAANQANIGGNGNAKFGITSIAVHSTDSNIVYLTTSGTTGLVLKSTNGGTTFTSYNTGLPNIGKNVIVHQSQNVNNPLYVGTYLGVYYRDDTMTQWEPFDTNLPNLSVNDLEINLVDHKLIAGTYGRGVWECSIPYTVPDNDVALIEILSPSSIEVDCVDAITPQILVKNNGLNVINTVTFNYTIVGVVSNSYNYVWNGTINSGQTATITLPATTLSFGSYSLNITATCPNDAFSDNNSGSSKFNLNKAAVLNTTNTFEGFTDNLLTYNLSGSQLWQRGSRVGGMLATGTNKVYATTLSGNYFDGTTAYLVSGCYNLANVSGPQISFKLAFDLEENWDVVYVQYTTDNGLTWQVLGEKGPNWYNSDRTNASSGSADDCQNCPGAQWTGTDAVLKTYTYSLASLSSQTNVIFRIVFVSDAAVVQQGAVVDDFLVSGTLSTETFELKNIAIYPNPSKGVFNIAMGTVTPKQIEVYDITGKTVYTRSEFQDSSREISLNLTNLTTGVYFVKIASEDQSVVKKIIKE